MKLGSANLLRAGKRELKSLGDDCDDACFPAYCCANFELRGICRGFKLLNGDNRKKLNAMLTDNDVLYIESCMRMIQNGHNEAALVPEVLRYLKRPEDHSRESGFTAMLTAARSSIPTSEYTELAEPHSNSGFLRMLEESSKNATDENVQVERVIQNIPRQAGFAAMLDCARSARSVSNPKPKPEVRGRYGFRGMLDGASRGMDMLESDALDDKPRVRRYMGFANMLDGASRGTE